MNKLVSLILLLIITLFLSHSVSAPWNPTIHDVLRSEGLPAGLFPQQVHSYILHYDGRLEVFLEAPCYAEFDTIVHFDAIVRANLSYGRLSGVEGLTQIELFLWFGVRDIIVENPNSGVIVFDIGVAFKQLARSLFEYPPKCSPEGALKKRVSKNGGYEAMR